MNITLLIANALIFLAFLIHTIMGDRELHLIQPESGSDNNYQKTEKWTMARCGWHWISIDLLLATIGIGIINFTNYLENEKFLLQLLSIYFLSYAIIWTLTIYISRQFPKNYLKLGQWLLLLVISALIFFGI